MSASRSSPTVGINLRGLLLSAIAALPAKMPAFSSCMQQNQCCHWGQSITSDF